MSPYIYEWIVNASSLSPLAPLICLFIYLKRQTPQNLILAVSLFISFTFDVIGWILAQWFDPKLTCISNNLYFIVAFPAIMWFYHETLIKRSLKILIRVLTICFLAFALIFAFEKGLNELIYETLTLSSILITMASFFFVVDLNLMDESNFLKNRFHEINIMLNTSLALYYFLTIIMFAVSDYVFSHTTADGGRLFWAGHNALNISKNVGITVAFYLTAKKANHTHASFQESKPTITV